MAERVESVEFRSNGESVRLTKERFEELASIINPRDSDLAEDVQTAGEQLAMEIISRLGAAAWTQRVGETFNYHLVQVAIAEALKSINAAMSDVRESWSEDSKNRIKAYRKRQAQRNAGQMDLEGEEWSERR